MTPLYASVISLKRITAGQAEAVAANDDWGTALNARAVEGFGASVGAFALASGSKDAALLLALSPGTYTVEVSGAGTASGIALVEVYPAVD